MGLLSLLNIEFASKRLVLKLKNDFKGEIVKLDYFYMPECFFSKTVCVHLLPSGRWLDGWLQFLPFILHRKHQMSPIICTVRFIAYSASRGELGSK